MVAGIDVLALQKIKLGGRLAPKFSSDNDINSFAITKVMQENTNVMAKSTVSSLSTQNNCDGPSQGLKAIATAGLESKKKSSEPNTGIPITQLGSGRSLKYHHYQINTSKCWYFSRIVKKHRIFFNISMMICRLDTRELVKDFFCAYNFYKNCLGLLGFIYLAQLSF